MATRRRYCLLALLLGLATLVAAQEHTFPIHGLRSSMVVTTSWLADHLQDPNVVVLYIGHAKTGYDAGHIPGSQFIDLNQIAVTRNAVPNELPPVAHLQKIFEQAGVADGKRIILYGDWSGLLAARAYFTLDYLGFGDKAALLDGGLEKWRSEERPLTTDVSQPAVGKMTVNVNSKILVTLPEARQISSDLLRGESNTVLVDARPAQDYRGDKTAEGVKRPGHIPGAVNVPSEETIEGKENPEVQPVPDLRKLFTSSGVTPGKRVVTYCRTGVQASFDYFVAKFLGYDAAVYDGSFSEWSNVPDTRVVTGAASGKSPETH